MVDWILVLRSINCSLLQDTLYVIVAIVAFLEEYPLHSNVKFFIVGVVTKFGMVLFMSTC